MVDKRYRSLAKDDSKQCSIILPVEESVFDLKMMLGEIFIAIGIAISSACGRQFAKSALIIDEDHFYAPYFLVWFNTCFMILCYPVFLCYNRIFTLITFSESHKEAQTIFGSNGLTFSSFFIVEFPFVILWMLANYTSSQALGYISASAALVIINSHIALIPVLERIILKINFTIIKIIAMLLAIVGVVFSSMDGKFFGSVLGVFLTIACAFFVALYKVLFKKFVGNATLGQTSIFMSGLGAINMLFNVVPTAAMIFFDAEHVEWNYIPWNFLFLSALLSTVFNFLTNFGIALFGSFSSSMGMLLGIPISTAIDVIFRLLPLSVWFSVGSTAIILSFILTVVPLNTFYEKLPWKKGPSDV